MGSSSTASKGSPARELALDKDGNVIAFEFWSRGFSRLRARMSHWRADARLLGGRVFARP